MIIDNCNEADESIVSNTSPTSIGLTETTIIEANSNRTRIALQNIGTNAIMIKVGTGISTSDFHFILPKDTGIRDGNGGAIEMTEKGKIVGLCEIATSNIAIIEREAT